MYTRTHTHVHTHTQTRTLSVEAARSVVHAFVSFHLDCCNSLLLGISDSLLWRLRDVINAAQCLVTSTQLQDSIMPILTQLHWLPVRQHIEYMPAVLIYKVLDGLSPQYTKDDR